MTCIVSSPTKKAFREAIKDNAGEIWIEDPSIFRPRTFYASQLRPGEEVFVTNHPKRSWFAQVGRKADGTLYVK